MPATFAEIVWGSNVTSAIVQLENKGFTLLDIVSTMVRAEGTIFDRSARIFLKFDYTGLCEIAVFIDVTTAYATSEYNKLATILSQKYGDPEFKTAIGSIWWDDIATGATEIVLTLIEDQQEISVVYRSPDRTVDEIKKHEEYQEASKDLF